MIGDGSKEPVHFEGDVLENRDELIKAGGELALPAAILSTRQKLREKVFE